MDRVAQRLAEFSWPYADQDPAALNEIAKRVATVGRTENLATYAELVAGIDFYNASRGRGFSVVQGAGWLPSSYPVGRRVEFLRRS